MSEFIFGDCIEGMKRYPDNYFDLAVCDPPYGDGSHSDGDITAGGVWRTSNGTRFGGTFDRYTSKVYRTGGGWAKKFGKKS